MKKTLTIAALAVATLAGAASASTSFAYDRFGVDASQLTATERATVNNVIHSGASDSEIIAVLKSLTDNG